MTDATVPTGIVPASAPALALRRALGKWDLTAIGINQVIGSAVFILPSQVAAQLGNWSPIAFLAVGFASLDILQPSVLLAWRAEMRPLELGAQLLMPLVNPLLLGRYAAWRGIAARTVAAAMLGAMRSGRRGVQRYTWTGIEALARLTARTRVAPAPPRSSARAR